MSALQSTDTDMLIKGVAEFLVSHGVVAVHTGVDALGVTVRTPEIEQRVDLELGTVAEFIGAVVDHLRERGIAVTGSRRQ